MSSRSRGASVPFERGGRDEKFHSDHMRDRRPAEHAPNQFEGMFKGMGASSKEPISGKKVSEMKRIHFATHFAVGCAKWDDPEARGPSVSQKAYANPGIIYPTRNVPDKNASLVGLEQVVHDPATHWRTEQRQRFSGYAPQPRDEPFTHSRGLVHFGDDRPEMITSTGHAHWRPADPEAQRAAAFRAAGQGVLIQNSVFPKPDRVNPITAGPRPTDNYDLGLMNDINFGRLTANHSNMVMEHNHRDPILGHHVPVRAYEHQSRRGGARTTAELIMDENQRVPPLRSLAALRPG